MTEGDVFLTNCRLADGRLVDIGIASGKIAAVGAGAASLSNSAPELDIGGDLVLPGLVDGHMHLDKTLTALPWMGRAPFRALTLAEWARLRDALIAASFWALDRDGVDWPIDGDDQRTIAAAIASRGLDGTDWVIEGAARTSIGPVGRWSPRGALRGVGAVLRPGRAALGES